MYSFKLSPLVLHTSDWCNDTSEFGINESLMKIYNLKNNLNMAKSQLDDVYKLQNASRVMRTFDPFTTTKYQISKMSNAINVTNAWLKGYELIYHHNLIPTDTYIDSFVYFDNASFPGSFILATNHFTHTLTKIKNFMWNAASLLEETKDSKEPLCDSYKLYKNYPNNWLMHENNNGDITNIINISDFQNQFKLKYGSEHIVDLYTCDLGTDVSNNYNEQEKIHFILNISQIVCGLATLKSGGHMVVKHYTIFEPFTISYIALLTNLFKSVEITKPLTSKRTNSELYIVCKNYLYPFNPNSSQQKIYDLFMERISTKNTKQLVNSKYIQQQIIDIESAVSYIFSNQIQSLNFFIYTMRHSNDQSHNERCCQILKNINNNIRKKFNQIQIKPIHNIYKMRMNKKY
jgi:23S rRNA U2552 (ribose-2'-O)-methylase RlmE/FtsJ